MAEPTPWQGFRQEIDAALQLLAGPDGPAPAPRNPALAPAPAEALPSLLAQCRAIAARAGGAPELRSVHHLACTGGTLISRCIAAMANTQVLSEVDPLSPMAGRRDFTPTDLISLARHSSRPADTQTAVDIFLAGLEVLARRARQSGVDLVLRDHSHSQFCFGAAVPERPSLRDMLEDAYALRSLVSVRHPLDSYLGLQENRWMQFSPATMEEYARRYLMFLERHEGVWILRYEDFVAEPEARMRDICAGLGLSYNDGFLQVFPAIRLSGDSGRQGRVIKPRPRRPVSRALAEELGESPSYDALCARLGYDPAP